ncbi:MAG: hypothetical protein WD768_22025 [Phycisphaeraceae bacterium]
MPVPEEHDERAGLRGLFARLVRLLRWWWQADRVRISPREGRLLRLRPPCILRIGEAYVQVHRRCTGSLATGPYVLYECTIDSQPGQLIVSPGPPGAPGPPSGSKLIKWRLAGETQDLDADDVEVFG